jgi:hypothetical protein
LVSKISPVDAPSSAKSGDLSAASLNRSGGLRFAY